MVYFHKFHQRLSHVLSKTFLRPEEMPEAEIAKRILRQDAGWTESLGSRYYRLRTGRATWTDPECGHVPPSVLCGGAQYWITPWANKFRHPVSPLERWWRTIYYPGLYRGFRRIVLATKDIRGWIGHPISGILLVDNERERDLFIALDGHHRLGALSAIRPDDPLVPVYTPEDRVFDWKRTRRSGRTLGFSEEDSRHWWDHCFHRIYGSI